MKSIRNNKQIDFMRMDFYSLFTIFLVCSFFGWIFETIVILLTTGSYQNLGLLFIQFRINNSFPFIDIFQSDDNLPFIWGLPIIIIYGIGGSIVALCLRKIKSNLLLVFFVGMLIITFFELFSSYFCEYYLHKEYWDYSNQFINFQGRICLAASVSWGFIAVFTVKFLLPKVYFIYLLESKIRHSKAIVNLLIIYLLICIYKKYV